MNGDVFENWMETKVFPNVPAGSVIVVDRATYHMTLTKETKPASSFFNKQQLAEWLVEKKVKVKRLKTVEQLLTLRKI